ncbi:MAG: hypothetical protein KAH20_14560 [Methylococcales bacterium]|nr:hypothetical protein [Methylococcales bacterium]
MKIFFLVGVFFAITSNISANSVILDSVEDFSNTQRLNGWSYGYYDGDVPNAYSPDDFEELTKFIGNKWTLQTGSGGFWTEISNIDFHPNGMSTGEGRQRVEHWAVRRWISDSSGTLSLSGKIFKNNFTAGNGVVAHIFVNGKEEFSQFISAQDKVGIDYSFNVNVKIGTQIDFAIDPFKSQDSYDGTTFTAKGSLLDCWATYKDSTLQIPCVKVKNAFGQESIYKVAMQYKSFTQPMNFVLTSAELITARGNLLNNQSIKDCWATYTKGSLHIPCVRVINPLGQSKYDVNMQFKPLSKPMNFELTGNKQK